MTSILFILAASVSQSLSLHAVRGIQAHASSFYKSVAWNYVVSTILGLAYLLISGIPGNWLDAVPYGIFTGFFYIVTLMTMIRSMGQRGLAVTIAIANLSMVMPVLIAIAWGERPNSPQITGILLAAVAIPILSLCTTKGRAIKETPSVQLAFFLFFMRGLAAVGNLLAHNALPSESIPGYLVFLFGSCLVFTLIALIFIKEPGGKQDIKHGSIFGFFNILATFTLMLGLQYVPGSLFFASYSVLGLSLTALIAIILWRERIQTWGWIGFVLAVIATMLMNLN